MKKIISLLSMLAISITMLGCFNDEAPETKDVPLKFDSLDVEYNNVKYPCNDAEPVKCWLPYKADKTNLRLYFEINDALSLYIDGVKVVSGESVFDFTNGVTFALKDKKGNEISGVLAVVYNANTEAKLYSMSVMLYNSATSAYDLEYLCSVDEVNKKVTVDIDKTRSQLSSVKFKFIVSDNAIFSMWGFYFTSEVSVTNMSSLTYGTPTIQIIAQDTTYKTDYQFTRTCSDCME